MLWLRGENMSSGSDKSKKQNVLILGAAGRDFHDFLTYWRHREDVNVVAFTASQIPGIGGRTLPGEITGPKYPNGLKIYDQKEVKQLIDKLNVDTCTLAFSDLPYDKVMHIASEINAAGANFSIISPLKTMIESTKPVISVCAVRTGVGKSQTSRYICDVLKNMGKKFAVIRHPMPYGDLLAQRCQRYEKMEDLEKHKCTIEEREEYETHIEKGNLLFAGVDYEMILREAEKEADVIIWDGGNNDLPFYKPDLHLVIADALRPGHELSYYPGETNVRLAQAVLINKINDAEAKAVSHIERSLAKINPNAPILKCHSKLTPKLADDAEKNAEEYIKGKRVLVIEDGPTLTHGGMVSGAGYALCKHYGVKEVIDPRPFAKGTIADTFKEYSHLKKVLPAMGYGDAQTKDLEDTVQAAEEHCDVVVVGTPINLAEIIKIRKPVIRAIYDLQPENPDELEQLIKKALSAKDKSQGSQRGSESMFNKTVHDQVSAKLQNYPGVEQGKAEKLSN